MKTIYKLLILFFTVAGLSACSQTLPLISHAHVGHALTTWHDTPNQDGLYINARKEANEALSIIQAANSNSENQQLKKRAIKKVAYILNPEIVPLGDENFNKRYGIIRAMEGVLDHIEYAASSDDASLNLISSVSELSKNAEPLMNLLTTVSAAAAQPEADNINEQLSQLLTDLDLVVNGKREGDSIVFYGMANFTDEFNAMLERETNPRYEPLPRKYVLGLVRLPNGRWGYKLKNSQPSSGNYY